MVASIHVPAWPARRPQFICGMYCPPQLQQDGLCYGRQDNRPGVRESGCGMMHAWSLHWGRQTWKHLHRCAQREVRRQVKRRGGWYAGTSNDPCTACHISLFAGKHQPIHAPSSTAAAALMRHGSTRSKASTPKWMDGPTAGMPPSAQAQCWPEGQGPLDDWQSDQLCSTVMLWRFQFPAHLKEVTAAVPAGGACQRRLDAAAAYVGALGVQGLSAFL